MNFHVSYLLESEYNTISLNPKFYYISVTCELLTICHTFESLFFSVIFFFLSFYRGNWVDWILGVPEVIIWSLGVAIFFFFF